MNSEAPANAQLPSTDDQLPSSDDQPPSSGDVNNLPRVATDVHREENISLMLGIAFMGGRGALIYQECRGRAV